MQLQQLKSGKIKTQAKQKKKQCIDIAIFRGAETFNRYVNKGSKVLISGSLELDTWKDQQTQQNRQKHKVNVEEFEFLNSKKDSGGHTQQNPQMQSNQQYQQNMQQGQQMINDRMNYDVPSIDVDNDEIPFNED